MVVNIVIHVKNVEIVKIAETVKIAHDVKINVIKNL